MNACLLKNKWKKPFEIRKNVELRESENLCKNIFQKTFDYLIIK